MLRAKLTDEITDNVAKYNKRLNDEVKTYFLNGSCYWYAKMLQERFRPWFNTEIMYNPIQNHFSCKIKDNYYDANGIIAPDLDEWLPWSRYIALEPKGAARIYRDCIWQIEEEEWEKLPTSYRETPWIL